jgi:hypothetical protein
MTQDKLTAAKHTPDCSSTITAFKIFCEAMASELEETARQRDLLLEAVKSANDLLVWIIDRISSSEYELTTWKRPWQDVERLQELFAALRNGRYASYEAEFKEALAACGVK